MARRRTMDPHTKDPRDPIELISRFLVGSSYRVPVEGRSSKNAMQASDVAAAVGYMPNRLMRETSLAVATRAPRPQIARLSLIAYRRVMRAVLQQRPRPLDLARGEDRWRLRLAIYDAAYELVWPERRKPYGELAKLAKMRKDTYIRVHRCATAVLQESLNDARREFGRRLFGND